MPDPHVLAFFPWAYIEEPLAIGALRLLPYRDGELPGDLPNIKQKDIAGVLGAYCNRSKHPITRATLLEYGDWQAGMPLTEDLARELFRVRELIAFSALSCRRLFRGHSDYCNSHTYSLVLQRFKPGDTGTFAFSTRRRDGGTSHLWGSDDFAFHRPNHVDHNPKVALDVPLLAALLSLSAKHRVNEAIVEFNAANTDSSDIPSHVEVVMCKSALEWVLQVGSNAKALVQALDDRLNRITPVACDGPLNSAWMAQWQHQTRPLLAWAREFCAVRGISAHGVSGTQFVWGDHQHLAFFAIFFPLLLKLILADEGFFTLDSGDHEHLRHIEQYLMHDPFARGADGEEPHPWVDIATHARMTVWAERLYPDLD